MDQFDFYHDFPISDDDKENFTDNMLTEEYIDKFSKEILSDFLKKKELPEQLFGYLSSNPLRANLVISTYTQLNENKILKLKKLLYFFKKENKENKRFKFDKNIERIQKLINISEISEYDFSTDIIDLLEGE